MGLLLGPPPTCPQPPLSPVLAPRKGKDLEKGVWEPFSGLPPRVLWVPGQTKLRLSEITSEYSGCACLCLPVTSAVDVLGGFIQPASQAELALGMEPPEAWSFRQPQGPLESCPCHCPSPQQGGHGVCKDRIPHWTYRSQRGIVRPGSETSTKQQSLPEAVFHAYAATLLLHSCIVLCKRAAQKPQLRPDPTGAAL